MTDRLLALAASVIARANRERPADAVLRETLHRQQGLARDEGRWVSRAVFAYYRWLGWLAQSESPGSPIERALRLADEFQHAPEQFAEAELRARALADWVAQEAEITATWLRALQTEPPMWLRARPGQGADLAAAVQDCEPAGSGPLADALRYGGSADLFRTQEFRDGRFEIQDLNSQAVGWLCDPQPGETWWDACAGEGGKTLHLADQMQNQGLIWATDRAAWRLRQLKRRAARAQLFNYRSRVWEGGPTRPTQARFDGVLVDAPCSNLGTWHRNPHARWTVTPQDVRELAAVQLRLLAHAAPAVKPGGKLIYAVCTITRAETTEVLVDFARDFPEFEPLPLRNPLQPAAPAAPHWWLASAPGGGNGMFVAAWRRS